MIEYVVPQSPDDRILFKAQKWLKDENLLIIPTDTNWVAVCDPFSKKAVDKLYQFKKLEKAHNLSLLCQSIKSASEVAFIENLAFKLLRNKVPGPFTFIFKAKKNIIKSLKASKKDHQIGIRFPEPILVQKLLDVIGTPVLSTNIPLLDPLTEGQEGVEDHPYGYQVEEAFGHSCLIIDPGEYSFKGPSTIIDFTNGIPELIRTGQGSPGDFGL